MNFHEFMLTLHGHNIANPGQRGSATVTKALQEEFSSVRSKRSVRELVTEGGGG